MSQYQDRQAAIVRAQLVLQKTPLFLDTETTGLESSDEIVEICILDHTGEVVVDSLVRPTKRIPAGATRVHGISNQMVQDAPTWAELWPQVLAALADKHVGIYNADFDLRMMRQSHERAGLVWEELGATAFCVMKLYASFFGEANTRYGGYRWQSLENAGRQCHIPLPNSHRAQADTELTRQVLLHMAQQEWNARV